jgi:TetR/AcrR family fatty acid metabolism transcriptional regulator
MAAQYRTTGPARPEVRPSEPLLRGHSHDDAMSGDRKKAKRQRILDAAVVEIARRGYYGTTVAMIAGRAGVADGTIYLYFESKEDILVSIFERAMGQFIAEARRIVDDAAANPEDRLRRLIALHLTLLGEDRDLAVIFQVEFRHTLHVMQLLSRAQFHEYLGLIARVVEQGQRAGLFQSDADPLFTAKAVFGVLDEMATDWVLSKKNTRMGTRAEPVSELVLRGLRAP